MGSDYGRDRLLPGNGAAVGRAGAHSVIADRPEGKSGGMGLGFNGGELLASDRRLLRQRYAGDRRRDGPCHSRTSASASRSTSQATLARWPARMSSSAYSPTAPTSSASFSERKPRPPSGISLRAGIPVSHRRGLTGEGRGGEGGGEGEGGKSRRGGGGGWGGGGRGREWGGAGRGCGVEGVRWAATLLLRARYACRITDRRTIMGLILHHSDRFVSGRRASALGLQQRLGLRPSGLLGLIPIIIVILLLLRPDPAPAPTRSAKRHAACASIGTRFAISAVSGLDAVLLITRFLMPWTIPGAGRRL